MHRTATARTHTPPPNRIVPVCSPTWCAGAQLGDQDIVGAIGAAWSVRSKAMPAAQVSENPPRGG